MKIMEDHERMIEAAKGLHKTFEGRDFALVVFNDHGTGECIFGTTPDENEEKKTLVLIKILRTMLEGMENAILAQQN